MKTQTAIATGLFLAMAVGTVYSAHASVPSTSLPATAPITLKLDFDKLPLALSTTMTSNYGLGEVASSAGITTYATKQLQTAAVDQTAKLTVSGAIATTTYNAEKSGDQVRIPTANTLGADGGTYLLNNNFGYGNESSDFIKFDFDNFFVTDVQFQYEIFPDYTCALASSTCQLPDFSFTSDNTAGTTKWFTAVADQIVNGYVHRLAESPTIHTGNATSLTFHDWPAEIAIDNVTITGCTRQQDGKCGGTSVPEPTSFLLMGIGLLGLVAGARKKF